MACTGITSISKSPTTPCGCRASHHANARRSAVVGGEGNGSVASGVFPRPEAYTVADDRWDSLPEMKTPRHGMGGASPTATSMFQVARRARVSERWIRTKC
jgi:hypothetical protein